MMKFQVLLSTMRRNDLSVLDSMKLNSNAVVINQGKENSNHVFDYKNKKIHWINRNEFGIGKSRNEALQFSEAEISLFADDDVEYDEDYELTILKEFENHPDADIIIFGLISTNLNRIESLDYKFKRIHFFNCLKYGAFRIAIKTESVRSRKIVFSTLFGGGAKYGSGEDSLFIVECLRKKCKIYASNKIIGKVHHGESTWFKGYDAEYFKDKGALFCAISSRWSHLLCLQHCLRHQDILCHMSLKEAYKFMRQGIHEYRMLKNKE